MGRVSVAKWLERVAPWCLQVEGLLLDGRGRPKAIRDAQIGELAYVTSGGGPHVRVICGKDPSIVSLCDLGSEVTAPSVPRRAWAGVASAWARVRPGVANDAKAWQQHLLVRSTQATPRQAFLGIPLGAFGLQRRHVGLGQDGAHAGEDGLAQAALG